MDLHFTAEQEKWRKEFKDFLDEEVKKAPPGYFVDDIMSDIHEQDDHWNWTCEFTKRVGAKGWISMGWPTKFAKYGGRDASPIETALFSEQMALHEATLAYGVNTLGGPILTHGSKELQEEFLPKIAAGEITCMLGLSESDAGSDLANAKTRAIKQPDGDYLVNGHKIFSSMGHRTAYTLLLAITDPNARKRYGFSRFAVNLKSPGITISTWWNMSGKGHHQNQVFFDDVRVPARNLIGVENQAWGEMNRDRGGGSSITGIGMKVLFNKFVKFCQETKRNGKPLSEDPVVRHKLAELGVELDVIIQISWASVTMREKTRGRPIEGVGGGIHTSASAILDMMRKEWTPRFAIAATQIVGPLAQVRGNPVSHLQEGAKWAPVVGDMPGWIERYYRGHAFDNHRHGTPEVLRMILATRGLGLPR
ncbi:MAG: acyl-CoA dehydrogenase family protein [Chloroflexi bacterium]|nr:acyl-CoA dehydrogenase family protein [Chloroflexota bacterium]MBI3040757.1 acyl-CoA dehydrogenase family protein [Chloroflexota bacterium]MBI3931711.1 acyl-CoA dehydrogenase family protein [Chloroflexota bacterium]